jgi:hypothetical protein
MTVENKPGVVRPMRKALKVLGRASYRAIARQLARNVDLAKLLSFWNVEGGVGRSRRTAGFDGSAEIAAALLLNAPQRKVASEMM